MANSITYLIKVDSSDAEKNLKGLQGEAQRTDSSLNQVSTGANKAGAEFEATGNKSTMFSKALSVGVVAVAASAGAALVTLGGKIIEVGSNYEKAVKDLSAITGIAGERLNGLANSALVSSAKTGIAAGDIVEAYKLVASQLAEKIDFGTDAGIKQLQAVSKEALTLSKAAGIDLKTAVEATSSTINQFGLEAGEANRIVNVLAAGAKFGAAEVGDIAEAFKNAGTSAAGANITIEDTNAAVQVLAQNAIRGAEAGTGLRNIFTILQTSGEKLAKFGIEEVDLKTNGLTATLEQLKPILNDTTALNEIFGRENLNVASILIKNAESVENMSLKLTGTQTAYEQAAIQTETFGNALDRLSNALTARLIQAFDSASAPLTGFVGALADLIAPGDSVAESFTKQQERLNVLVGTINTAGIAEEDRLKLIKQLQTEYPDFIGNIDAEKLSNEELSKALDKANNSYIAKIALAEMDAKIQEAAKEQADLVTERFTQQTEVIGLINEAQNKYGVQIDANATLSEKYAQAQAGLKENFNGLGVVLDPALRLSKSLAIEYNNLTSSAGGTNSEIEKQSKAIEELNARKAELKKNLIENGFLTDEEAGKVENLNAKLGEVPANVKTNVEVILPELAALESLKISTVNTVTTNETASPSGTSEAPELVKINNLKTISGLQAEISATKQLFDSAETDGERERHAQKINFLSIELEAKLQGVDSSLIAETDAHAVRMAMAEEYFNVAANGMDVLSNLNQAFSARELQNIEKKKRDELSSIDEQLKKENLSEAEKTKLLAQRKAVEEKYNKKALEERKDAAIVERGLAILSIASNTAEGIMKSVAASPLTLGMPWAGIIGGMGAAQVAAVLATPLPAFETGGLVEGGEKLIRINEKGQEFVINAESTARNRELLEKINADPDFGKEFFSNSTSNTQVFTTPILTQGAATFEGLGGVGSSLQAAPPSLFNNSVSSSELNQVINSLNMEENFRFLAESFKELKLNFDFRQFNENQRTFIDLEQSTGLRG